MRYVHLQHEIVYKHILWNAFNSAEFLSLITSTDVICLLKNNSEYEVNLENIV